MIIAANFLWTVINDGNEQLINITDVLVIKETDS